MPINTAFIRPLPLTTQRIVELQKSRGIGVMKAKMANSLTSFMQVKTDSAKLPHQIKITRQIKQSNDCFIWRGVLGLSCCPFYHII